MKKRAAGPGNPIGPGHDADNLTRLAKDLKVAGVEPTPGLLADADVVHACGRAGVEPTAFTDALLAVYPTIIVTADMDALTRAWRQADAPWRQFKLHRQCRQAVEVRQRLMAMIYWLNVEAGHRETEWFPLPVVRLGELLGMGRNAVGAMLKGVRCRRADRVRPGLDDGRRPRPRAEDAELGLGREAGPAGQAGPMFVPPK